VGFEPVVAGADLDDDRDGEFQRARHLLLRECAGAVDLVFGRLEDQLVVHLEQHARAQALARVTTEVPRLSTLHRRPLPGWADGGPHAGGALFTGPDDPAATAVLRWIEAEPLGGGGEDVELDALEALFADTVLPVLVQRCGFAGCHGPTEVANTAFAAVPDRETGRFAPLDVRAAYRSARKHLDLWSADPRRSRLVACVRRPAARYKSHRSTHRPSQRPRLSSSRWYPPRLASANRPGKTASIRSLST